MHASPPFIIWVILMTLSIHPFSPTLHALIIFCVYLQIQSLQRPTLHVDAFLYDDDTVDALCEEGKMSRNYCMSCGSRKTAPLGEPYTKHISRFPPGIFLFFNPLNV